MPPIAKAMAVVEEYHHRTPLSTSLSVSAPLPSLSLSQKAIAVLPLGIFGMAFVTILASYKATFAAGILDFQHGLVTTPPISMLMFDGPGRLYGKVGFSAVALLFLSMVSTFRSHISSAVDLDQHPAIRFGLFSTSLIAFCSLALVGLVPLQKDLVAVIKRQVPITWDSIIHQSSALVFFLFGVGHMGLWLRLTYVCHPSAPIHRRQSPKSFALKMTCFVLCFVPLPAAVLLHPISPLRRKLNLHEQDLGGIMQYAFVASVAIFFASYSMELWYLQQHRKQQQTQTGSQMQSTTDVANGKKDS